MQLLDPGTTAQRSLAVREAFERHHGRPPAAAAWAPGRINLIGEHTDYNDGLCLPVALPHATYVAVSARDDTQVHIASEQQPTLWNGSLEVTGPGRLTGWPTYVGGVLWALGEQGINLPGLDICVDSSVPVGAGLASSAALSCATALAVTEVAGLELTDELRDRLVAACVRTETEVARAPTGGMDQTVALRARGEHALLLDFDADDRPAAQHIPLRLRQDDLRLLVVDTRVAHTLSDGGFAARRTDCEFAAAELGLSSLRHATQEDLARISDPVRRRRARHVVTETQRVREVIQALGSGDYPAVGMALSEGHASLRDDFEVSSAELDLVVSAAIGAGAVAARMTGGGFGGSAFAIVPTATSETIAAAIEASFVAAGFRSPQFLVASASQAGGRLVP